MKYFLSFSGWNNDHFYLMTCDDQDIIVSGRLSEIDGADEDWQDALDNYFEAHYGISPDEWEVG